jgi:tetratricopeptide (TPR) repeat protein
MTITPLFDLRRVIPRWRNSRIALTTGEVFSIFKSKGSKSYGHDQFLEKLNIWHELGQIELAAEVVSAAISQGFVNEGIDAAEFLISQSTYTTPAVLLMAKDVLVRTGRLSSDEEDLFPVLINRQKLYSQIHNLRVLLNKYPRNALMWADLSHAYIMLGQLQQSSGAMVKALILAPENRFVLRSATRLFIHLDEPDIAHKILISKDITHHDPWLLAAEIATAAVAGLTPKLVRPGKNILAGGKYSYFHTAELASALATLDLSSGSIRSARKLFQISLIESTDNSVAQSVWAKKEMPTLDIDSAILRTPRVYEARALNALINLDWVQAVEASKKWLADESFSSRPAKLGSFAASVGLENYSLAEELTMAALIANPNDFGLINNLAFALANQGKLKDARKVLDNASKPVPNSQEEIVIKATEGLVCIREGNIIAGKALYLEAISLARKLLRYDLRSMASIYYAREMFLAAQFTKSEALLFAEEACSSYTHPHITWLLNRLIAITSSFEITNKKP